MGRVLLGDSDITRVLPPDARSTWSSIGRRCSPTLRRRRHVVRLRVAKVERGERDTRWQSLRARAKKTSVLLQRRADELSGGQSSIALARALVTALVCCCRRAASPLRSQIRLEMEV